MLKRPMLAASTKAEDLSKLAFPLLASPKIDGVRAVNVNGKLVSRTLKDIPNALTQCCFGTLYLDGLDGELVVGNPTDHNLMQQTMSGVMSRDGAPKAEWFVFDDWKLGAMPFAERIAAVKERISRVYTPDLAKRIHAVSHTLVSSYAELQAYEEKRLAEGYEGVMVRSLRGPYKQGRSSVREGYLLKVKRFADAEAEVIGAVELRHNGNAATVDARGFTKRSTHAANKQGGGVLGCLKVRDLSSGVEFEIGTGFTWAQREQMWENRDKLPGLLVKYQHFTVGAVDKPRFPIFLGFRDRRDV